MSGSPSPSAFVSSSISTGTSDRPRSSSRRDFPDPSARGAQAAPRRRSRASDSSARTSAAGSKGDTTGVPALTPSGSISAPPSAATCSTASTTVGARSPSSRSNTRNGTSIARPPHNVAVWPNMVRSALTTTDDSSHAGGSVVTGATTAVPVPMIRSTRTSWATSSHEARHNWPRAGSSTTAVFPAERMAFTRLGDAAAAAPARFTCSGTRRCWSLIAQSSVSGRTSSATPYGRHIGLAVRYHPGRGPA